MHFWKVITSFVANKEYRELLFASMLILFFGTLVMQWLENWRWIDALYFCFMTLTTIGYGDFAPKTDAGKLFSMFYVMIGLGLILGFINTVFEHYNNVKRKSNH
jgi:voltage-gated potassium channel